MEMLFRCNILALVGGGRNPKYPQHKVMIWDDHQNRCIGELAFRSEVRAVKLRRDRVVVATFNRVYVYNFADLTLADHIDTDDNPRGLCALSASSNSNVLACPGPQKGQVRVELYDIRKRVTVVAHETVLACIALNHNGTRLATASEKGTLIRIFDTNTGELLQELRRGTDKADINCIAFHPNSTLLACTSDKGTVHIFKLNAAVSDPSFSWENETHGDPLSRKDVPHPAPNNTEDVPPGGLPIFGNVRKIFPQFLTERSFAQFRLPKPCRSICAFGIEPNTILVICADGSFYQASFEKGNEAVRIMYASIAEGPAPAPGLPDHNRSDYLHVN